MVSRSRTRAPSATGAALLCFALLICRQAAAANPVVLNGDFENAFGPADWKPGYLVGGASEPGFQSGYLVGGASDFAVKGRTTASRNGSSKYGGALKPFH